MDPRLWIAALSQILLMSRFVFARRVGLARKRRLPGPPSEPLLQPWSCTQKSEDRGWASAQRGQVGGYTVNPFLFIRGLSFPSCIQASLSLNCLKITIPRFPYNCLPVSYGDIGFNPFLIIRGLSYPGSVQTSLTQNCAWNNKFEPTKFIF